MARRRHSSNPAKVKAQYEALTGSAPAAPASERTSRAAFRLVPILAMAGAALLSLSFTPFECWPLAYVALAPWTLAMLVSPKRWWGILWCFLAGVAFYGLNFYWIAVAEGVGYLAAEPYLWLYFLAAAIMLGGLRGLLRRNIPAWIALPVVWVALEFARSHIIGGFPWLFLGHSQYRQIRIIQIADLTSDYGVSFFVAMVNGAIVDLLRCFIGKFADNRRRLVLRQPPIDGWHPQVRLGVSGGMPATKTPPSGLGGATLIHHFMADRALVRAAIAGVFAVVVALAGLMGYGTWRLGQASAATHPGPVVGLVQLAFPISLEGGIESEHVFDDHLALSESLVGAGCQLVIWPETMLPKGLNPEIFQADLSTMKSGQLRSLAERFFGPKNVWDNTYSDDSILSTLERLIRGMDHHGQGIDGPSLLAQARRMGELSRKLGCPVLAGGTAVRPNPRPLDDHDLWVTQNSAMWFDGDYKAVDQYCKVHLVPFGEYVPFKYSWPWLHKLLRWFVPPVMEQIEPGVRFNHFTLKCSMGVPPMSLPLGSDKSEETARHGQDAHATNFRIATPICFEGAFARVCRDMVYQDGKKQVDILANMSNDGWFVRDGKGTIEQPQHLCLYVFRAIENRVPVVRAVNTGISASIDSSGRIVASIQPVMSADTLVLDGRMRNDEQYAQGHGPVVLVDDRVSGYDRAGDLFAEIVTTLALAMLTWAWWKSRVLEQ